MIRVVVDSIRVSLMSQHRVVVLRETEGARYLPIWIGPFEADSITIELQGVPMVRPLTHDLLKSVLDELGAKVEYVVVNDLREDTFFARIILDVNGERHDLDSRPSDAIALAVRVKAPIFVAPHVMDEAGILSEAESGTGEVLSEEEEENLSVFKQFLENLDLDEDEGKSEDSE